MSNIKWISRREGLVLQARGEPEIVAIDCSELADEPFCGLSPWAFSPDWRIPVPGMKGHFSNSVQGIWEGLKVIGGRIDTSRFVGKPAERSGTPEGWCHEDKTLGVVMARELILIPAAHYFIQNYAPKEAVEYLLSRQREGREVYLFDRAEVSDFRDETVDYSFAAAVATHLNLMRMSRRMEPLNPAERLLFRTLRDEELTMLEKLEGIEQHLHNGLFRKAVRFCLFEHPENADWFHLGEALVTNGIIRSEEELR